MKTLTFRVLLGVVIGLCLVAGATWGTCVGDEEVAGEWIFEEEADGWAVNTGFNGDVGNLGLTGGAAFSTNVPPVNCDCGHSLFCLERLASRGRCPSTIMTRWRGR